jgi:acetyl-CoA carboxylase biotin carboxylase subunit
MIKSILIANRGEIAIRIARTARRMGIKTYMVRTMKEPNAVYLSSADHIIDFPDILEPIPEFLDIENLVKLAKENKVEAIHPGYGYLSENAQFAQHCTDQGIVFIGPSPEIIYAMGDKVMAKEIAARCGVPMLGGSSGSVSDFMDALAVAHKIGYPVIIKASAGGGGRGMRIVRKEKEMQPMFEMASSEAQNAFNNPSVFIEKYLENPKHIEFQVVGDKLGNVVHLGERECSIQRKHQKMMEEAPSPALDEHIREKMAHAAITLAKEVKYESLGTVEFLLDKKGNFYFMEMNTRIQVEHPVTEMITGLDLVELQILIASGEKLPVKQNDIKLNGWAIECRINAEDAQSGFAPSMGIIRNLRLPQGNNIRIDTGIKPGSEITPFFDSMVAKLVVHAPTRPEAIAKALTSLEQFQVKGIKTTIPFCKAVLHHPDFCSGNFDTSFIEKKMASMVYQEEDEELLAALLAAYTHTHESRPDQNPETLIDPWVLNKRIRHL